MKIPAFNSLYPACHNLVSLTERDTRTQIVDLFAFAVISFLSLTETGWMTPISVHHTMRTTAYLLLSWCRALPSPSTTASTQEEHEPAQTEMAGQIARAEDLFDFRRARPAYSSAGRSYMFSEAPMFSVLFSQDPEETPQMRLWACGWTCVCFGWRV